MSTGPMIKTFQVIKDGTSSLSPCLKHLTINAFPFEAVKKARGALHCHTSWQCDSYLRPCHAAGPTPARLLSSRCYPDPSDGVTPPQDSDELWPFARPAAPESHPDRLPSTILPPCVRTNQAPQRDRATPAGSRCRWYPSSTSDWGDPQESLALCRLAATGTPFSLCVVIVRCLGR